ncbi:MAG: hypothetical protein DMF63_07645 [Acidobacteria bacterium]|nr:MAG: hypothetical protein DMF63_07645 [Acidobacteriota bacterium]
MNLIKSPFRFFVFPIFIITFALSVSAQSDPVVQMLEPSYDVALHVVIGSNDGSRTELPANLSTISKHLKGNFSFSNYRLANTFLGRISNSGTVEYKSVSNILGQETDADSPTFLEWSMGNFRAVQNGFQARAFRFGARVPVRTGSVKDAAGLATPVINYESVGVSMNLIGLPANTPTLIGTISLPKTAGTIFLVATVRTPEM